MVANRYEGRAEIPSSSNAHAIAKKILGRGVSIQAAIGLEIAISELVKGLTRFFKYQL